MALRNIVTEGDKVLTKMARPVTEYNARLHRLLDDLSDTVEDADGLGLAAPQIGVLRRVAVVIDEFENEETGEWEGEIIELVNPRITEKDGEASRYEGCLSFPGLHGYITRFDTVTVEAEDRFGETFTLEASGMLARAVQHEIDHLDGKTIRDNAAELLTEEELDELIKESKEKEQTSGSGE